MGFMDKVKATTEKVAEKAQQGVHQGQQKLSEVQERKRVDGLLHDLGSAVFMDRTGRGSATITADIERLIAELRDAEANGVTIQAPVAGGNGAGSGEGEAQADVTGEPAAETPPGSYKLDDVE